MKEIFEYASNMLNEGLNSIFERPDILILNILAFVVMLFFVRFFFWEKINAFLERRQEASAKALTEAEEERQKAQTLQDRAKKEYASMKKETDDLKARLVKEAYKEQEKLIEEAKASAKHRLEQAERDIDYEIAQANEQIKISIKEIAFKAASKIVKREIDESLHQDIFEELLKNQPKVEQ